MKILLSFIALLAIADASGGPTACEDSSNPSNYACLIFRTKFKLEWQRVLFKEWFTREVSIAEDSHLQCLATQPVFEWYRARLHSTIIHVRCQDVSFHTIHGRARFHGQRALQIVKELR